LAGAGETAKRKTRVVGGLRRKGVGGHERRSKCAIRPRERMACDADRAEDACAGV